MSATKTKLLLHQAEGVAKRLMEHMAPACERITVAGSIRRRRPEVGDIELVAIPKRESLFGSDDGDSKLDPVLQQLVNEGRLSPLKTGGEKYKQYAIVRAGIPLDLFLVTPESWGVQLAIRTGPSGFSQKLVTQKAYGGRLPDGCKVAEGRVWQRVGFEWERLVLPDEADFLELCGGWTDPEDRV